jgi:hypothetical protein
VAHGKSNRETADELVVAEDTVRTHVSNILSKLHLGIAIMTNSSSNNLVFSSEPRILDEIIALGLLFFVSVVLGLIVITWKGSAFGERDPEF